MAVSTTTVDTAQDRQLSSGEAMTAQPTPEPAPRRLDSTPRSLVGLVVVWGVLVLVFMAQRLSDSYIRLQVDGVDLPNRDSPLVHALDDRVKLLLPLEMNMRETSPREALQSLAANVGFTVNPRLEEVLSEEPEAIHFEHQPLYAAIHELIGNPAYGYALRAGELNLIDQRLQLHRNENGTPALEWQAVCALDEQPQLIVPTSQLEMMFTVALEGPTAPEPDSHVIVLEVWKGSEWLTAGRIRLRTPGEATLTQTARERIRLSVKPALDESQAAAQRFALGFEYLMLPESEPAASTAKE